MNQEAETNGPDKKGILKLTHDEIMAFDLILTRERLAAAEEKLAGIQLREAQKSLMEAAQSKAILVAKLGDKVGGKIRNATIVRGGLAYELE